MSNKAISPGELAIGLFVTVVENKPFIENSPSMFGETQTITHTDRSGMGDIHTILAIDLPYIVVRREYENTSQNFNYKIDTRRTVLMELSKEYTEALCPRLAKLIKTD